MPNCTGYFESLFRSKMIRSKIRFDQKSDSIVFRVSKRITKERKIGTLKIGGTIYFFVFKAASERRKKALRSYRIRARVRISLCQTPPIIFSGKQSFYSVCTVMPVRGVASYFWAKKICSIISTPSQMIFAKIFHFPLKFKILNLTNLFC